MVNEKMKQYGHMFSKVMLTFFAAFCHENLTLSVLLWSEFCVAATALVSGSSAPCRDRFLEPFSSTSIWNTAIGSNAQFASIDLYKKSSLLRGNN